MKRQLLLVIFALFWQASSAQEQQNQPEGGGSATSFSYQGSLKIAGAPANGNYDFEFRFFNAPTGGTQVGSTITQNNLAVTNGIFRAVLDTFGSLPPVTSGSSYLEVRVRPAGGGAFTTLTPRETVLSVPYAIRSLDSERLGGVDSTQYVTSTTGGANFIQNATTQQASSNFYISGTGTAGGMLQSNVVNANQYNIGGGRFMSVAQETTIVGRFAGGTNSTGTSNSVFGQTSGNSLTTGNSNAFFGDYAGRDNMTGNFNAFFGSSSGVTTTGSSNAFFGSQGFSLPQTTTGSNNSFFGRGAGSSNRTGSNNSLMGFFANVGADNLTNGTAIGSRAMVAANNSLVLGSINGVNDCTLANSCDSVKVGIGTTTPSERLHVVGNGRIDGGIGILGNGEFGGNIAVGGNGIFVGNVGIGTNAPQQTLHVNGLEVLSTGSQAGFKFRSRGSTSSNDDWVWYSNLNIARLFKAGGPGDVLTIQPTGEFAVNVLGSAGSVGLCRNASNQISTCSSSKRYKQNINSYNLGLSLIKQLRPVSFNWKSGGMPDLGLVAEEVADVEPLLTTTNEKGEVEGVKYDHIGVIAVNAIKEQQEVISNQQSAISELKLQVKDQNSKIADQQKKIDELKKIVCSLKSDAEVCKEK